MAASILCMDDDPCIRLIIKAGLEKHSHQVDLAEDGQDGLRLALENDYDLIICDLMMPRKDGYQFIDEFRAFEKQRGVPLASVPIIVLTARHSAITQKTVELVGAKYLSKPFKINELVNEVRLLTSMIRTPI